MKFAVILLVALPLALAFPAHAQGTTNQDLSDGSTKIPSHETPTYHCFIGFFMLTVKMADDNGDLTSLLETMGLPDSELLKTLMVRITDDLGKEKVQSQFSVSDAYADDPVLYQQEQHRLAKAKVRWHRQIYDSFLDLVESEGEERQRINDYIISEGRQMVQVAITGTGEYTSEYKEALLIFEEEGAYNPWLE